MAVSISTLLIAGLFFLVTMGLAVVPLLLSRLFVRSSESCPPQRSNHPVVTDILTACGFMLAAVVGCVALWFAHSQSQEIVASDEGVRATAVDSTESGTTPITSERSLFDGRRSHSVPPQSLFTGRIKLTWADVFVPLLLAATFVSLTFSRLRGGLLRGGLTRLAPVLFLLALLPAMFVAERHERHHRHAAARRAALMDRTHAMQQTAVVKDQQNMRVALERESVAQRMTAAVKTENPGHEQSGSFADDTPVTIGTADTAIAPDDAVATPTIVEYVGTKTDGVQQVALPDWTDRVDILGPLHVVKSGQHATVELAEQQALAELRAELTSDLVRRHPAASGWRPSDELVLNSGSILRRAVERSEITVGEFSNPMYEVYWQVDPTIGAGPLENAWRPSVVRQRLVWLGGGVGLLTLLLGSLAAGLRVDEQTGGRRRKALTLGTLAAWAVVGGAVLLAA